MSWLGYAKKKDLDKANDQFRKEKDRADEEKKQKEKAQNDAIAAQKAKEEEKQQKEKALNDALAAQKEKEEAQKQKEKAQNDAIAAQKAKEEEKKQKEKAQNDALVAQKATEEEKRAKKKAETEAGSLKESLEKNRNQLEKEHKESAMKYLQLEMKNKDFAQETKKLLEAKQTSEKEKKQLLSEKEKRESLEAEQKKFNWGPKKELTWTERDSKRLRDYIVKDREDSEGNELSMKLLVFGPTGHGKSSFCNGSRSAIRGDEYPATYHQVGDCGQGTLTKGFHSAPYGNHWIIDMAGIFESDRISSMNIEDIASGKTPFYAKITDTLDRKEKDGDVPQPGENDVSCVVVILRYDIELSPELKRQLGVIFQLGGKGVISCHIVLTRLDECDPQFHITENIPNLYKSSKVQAAVKRMSEEAGIPAYAISFVKNYTTETETDINTTLLHLRALERVIVSGLDQVEKRLDEKKQRKLYTKKEKQEEVKPDPSKGTLDSLTAPEKHQIQDQHEKPEKLEGGESNITMNEIRFMIIVLIFAVFFIYFKF